MLLSLSEIRRYPIKSCAGESLISSVVGPRGLLNDRSWMVVDDSGQFVTARADPKLLTLAVNLSSSGVEVTSGSEQEPLFFRLESYSGERREVRVWNDQVDAAHVSDHCDAWFSEFLGRSVSLVSMNPGAHRAVDPEFAQPEDEVGFADGFPLLVTTTASLKELNSHLRIAVEMDRFRPNLVVDGPLSPFAEDGWKRLRIGDLELELVKPCSRCIMTTVDANNGRKDPGREPLATLLRLRKGDDGRAYFGSNAIARSGGTVRVHDRVEQMA